MRLSSIAIAAASLALASPAAAQDPPPPLPPADVPPDPPPPLPPADKPEPPPPAAADPLPQPQDPPAPVRRDDAKRDDPRTLKGFTFRPPILIDTAFIGTHAGLGVAIGRESTTGVRVLVQSGTGLGQELVYDIHQSFVTGRLQAGASFFGRIEAGIDMTYAGFVVGDQNTAILFGGQSTVHLEPGLRVAIVRSPATGTALAARAYATIVESARLNPSRVIVEVAKEISDIAADPTRTACLSAGDIACALDAGFNAFTAMRVARSTYGGGVAVSLAQAVVSRFGVQATTGFEVARGKSTSLGTGDLGSTPFTFYVGAAPAVDFGPAVPIGVMAEYRFDFSSESFSSASGNVETTATRTIRHGVAAGVYYTGRRDLTVGAAFQGSFISTSIDAGSLPGTTQLSGLATMRYYF